MKKFNFINIDTNSDKLLVSYFVKNNINNFTYIFNIETADDYIFASICDCVTKYLKYSGVSVRNHTLNDVVERIRLIGTHLDKDFDKFLHKNPIDTSCKISIIDNAMFAIGGIIAEQNRLFSIGKNIAYEVNTNFDKSYLSKSIDGSITDIFYIMCCVGDFYIEDNLTTSNRVNKKVLASIASFQIDTKSCVNTVYKMFGLKEPSDNTKRLLVEKIKNIVIQYVIG